MLAVERRPPQGGHRPGGMPIKELERPQVSVNESRTSASSSPTLRRPTKGSTWLRVELR
jgi:hypothetical protein